MVEYLLCKQKVLSSSLSISNEVENFKQKKNQQISPPKILWMNLSSKKKKNAMLN